MKKRILIINPNSSEKMTADIRASSEYAIDDEFGVEVISMKGVPEALESFNDYTLAGAEICKYISENQINGTLNADGIIISCVGDPGLFGAKEICKVPVIGVAEAALSTALLLGGKFSILAASEKAKPMMEWMVLGYGLNDRMASVETLSCNIDALINDKEKLCTLLQASCKRAQSNGADVLVLGCAGMTMVSDQSEEISSIPIIDPVKAGIENLKGIIRANFKVSKSGLYA